MKKITAEDLENAAWLATLQVPRTPDKVPPGWFTVLELAEKIKKSREQTSNLVSAAFKRGELQKKTFRVMTGRGPFPVPHYKRVK
jgi:hypothetical protein